MQRRRKTFHLHLHNVWTLPNPGFFFTLFFSNSYNFCTRDRLQVKVNKLPARRVPIQRDLPKVKSRQKLVLEEKNNADLRSILTYFLFLSAACGWGIDGPGKMCGYFKPGEGGKTVSAKYTDGKKNGKITFPSQIRGYQLRGKKLCDKIVAAILQDTFTQPTGNKVTSRFYSYSEI